jgi:hypothetical protein
MVTSECLVSDQAPGKDSFDSLLAFSANAKYRQALWSPKSQVSEQGSALQGLQSWMCRVEEGSLLI